MDVELFYEFASTYSYPAVMTAESAARERGLALALRPFLLGPILAAQGYTKPPFIQFERKGRYMWRDLERTCAARGIPWRRPSVFPRKGVLPTRVALVGMDEGWGSEFSRRVYQLNFVQDREMEDEANIREILSDLGVAPDPVLARALSPENRTRLKEETARAEALGVFGAPTFVVGSELFWGYDRMQQALDWAAGAKAHA